MTEIIYFNGHLVPRTEAKLSPFDHGFLYGYGLFETMMAYEGHIFRLDRHLTRLRCSAESLGLRAKLDAFDLENACVETLQANKLKDKQMIVIRGLSFAPPGIAQMYSGRLFAGFVYMWAAQLSDHGDKPMTYYLFDFTLDSESDQILLELESGPLVSSEYFELKIDGVNASMPVQPMVAGEIIHIESPIEMIFGQAYNIKIINTESVIWDEDYIAMAI